jgi:hypothetical protein
MKHSLLETHSKAWQQGMTEVTMVCATGVKVLVLTVHVVWCVLCCLMVRDRPKSASFAVRPQAEAARVVTSTLRAFWGEQQAVQQGRSNTAEQAGRRYKHKSSEFLQRSR